MWAPLGCTTESCGCSVVAGCAATVSDQDDGYAGPRAGCGCGGQAVYAGSRPKTVTTVLGPVRITRAWYHCAACQHGFAPRDRQLGLRASGALSPGLAEMSALAGAEVSFTSAAALMAGLAGVTLSPGPSSGPPRPPARAASMSASSPVCVQRSR